MRQRLFFRLGRITEDLAAWLDNMLFLVAEFFFDLSR